MANTKLPARLLDTSAIPALNVTGDLTVDTNTLKVDTTNNRVGIGYTSPQKALHISAGSPVVRLEDSDGGYGEVSGSNGNIRLRADEGNTQATSFISFDIDGDELVRIKHTGYVGIGTPNPLAQLHVENSTSDGIIIRTTANVEPFIALQRNSGSNGVAVLRSIDGGDLRIDTGATGASQTTKMTIEAGGNVGIGTESPSAALEVNRGSAGYAGIFGAPQGSGRVILFKDNHASPNKYNWLAGSQYNINNGFEITPSTAVGGSTFTAGTGVAILQTGNVGIGTIAPAAKLAFGGLGQIWVNNDATNPFGLDTAPGELRLFTGNSNSYQMKFGKMATDGTTFTSHLTIGDDGSNRGNVGIGTDSPSTKLHIASGAAAADDLTLLTLENGNSTSDIVTPDTFIDFKFTDSNANVVPQARIGAHAGDGGSADTQAKEGKGYLTFHTSDTTATSGTVAPPERVRIDNTGRVGINRTPSVGSSKLEIGGADGVRLVVVEASGHTGGIGIQGGSASTKGFLLFSGGQIKVQLSDQTNVAYTADGLFNANSRPSKYKTTAAGQMLLGYQDNGSGLYSGAMGLEYDCVDGLGNTSYVGGFMMKDTAAGTVHLRINTNGNIYNTNNVYTSISDSRIKSDIIDASSQWDDIKALRVRKYKLAHQPAPYNDQLQIGVIAQELESAGMNGLIDEVDPDESQLNYAPELVGEKVKIVKYSILYMKAIKALQEAMTRIEQLEARVTELE